MSDKGQYQLIEGIRCFSPEVVASYANYPDRGFDLTDEGGESSFWVRSRNRLFKRLVHSYMTTTGKTRLLEIGCGTGNFIRKIVDNENLDITGSEVYLKGLLFAKKKLPNVDFIQFDVSQGVIGEQFDLIVAFDVIEHIENDVATISNMCKMLREGGNVVITVPQHAFLWSRLDEIVRHKRRYSRHDLVTKLHDGGFEVCYCTSFVFLLFPLMLMNRIFDKGRLTQRLEEAELKERVTFPKALDWIFDRCMQVDEVLIRMGLSLPFGGTLVVVARKC